MRIARTSIALLIVQLALVSSVVGKYLYQRWSCPKIWVQAAAYDPSLLMRGRYLSLRLEPEVCKENVAAPKWCERVNYQNVDFYISERASAPSMTEPGQELWIEVTLPPKGPARPLQLALKDHGVWRPLAFQ